MQELIFDPNTLKIVKVSTEQISISSPFNINLSSIDKFSIDMDYNLGLNIEKKALKNDLLIRIKPHANNTIIDAEAFFLLSFIFTVDNFDSLTTIEELNLKEIHPNLAFSMASITYSTSRGMIASYLQNTLFQNFILPVIDTQELITTMLQKKQP